MKGHYYVCTVPPSIRHVTRDKVIADIILHDLRVHSSWDWWYPFMGQRRRHRGNVRIYSYKKTCVHRKEDNYNGDTVDE